MRQEALREFFLRALPSDVWKDLHDRVKAADRLGKRSSRRRATIVRQWARKYNLDEAWIREKARDHISAWGIWPSTAGRSLIADPGVADPLPTPMREVPPRYAAVIETQEQYLKRVKAYMALVEDYYKRMGYRRAPQNHDSEHLKWLVEYQVNRKSLSALAREVAGDPDTGRNMVWKALSRLANDLSLPLRPGLQRGRQKSRPPKS